METPDVYPTFNQIGIYPLLNSIEYIIVEYEKVTDQYSLTASYYVNPKTFKIDKVMTNANIINVDPYTETLLPDNITEADIINVAKDWLKDSPFSQPPQR